MKVVQINSVCGIGSTGRIALNISEAIQKKGGESWIFYGRGQTSENTLGARKFGNKLGMYTHILRTRIFDSNGFGSKKATRELIALLKETQPDIIHLHNIHGYYLNIEMLFNYIKETNCQVVWTLHDTWTFSGHSATIGLLEDGSLPSKMGPGEKGEYPQTWFLDRWQHNLSKKKKIFSDVSNLTIVTPSKWLASLASKTYLAQYPVKVIHNGIDLSNFSKEKCLERFPVTEQDNQKKIKILGVSNVWVKSKGLSYFNELVKTHGDKYQVIIVGSIPKNQELDSSIIHIQKTESIEELRKFYSQADVFFNPTLRDNFPTINIEALACGTPVVTFDTGGSGESLSELTGVVCEDKELATIVAAIEKAKTFSEQDCLKQSQLFSEKVMTDHYLELYEELLNQTKIK